MRTAVRCYSRHETSVVPQPARLTPWEGLLKSLCILVALAAFCSPTVPGAAPKGGAAAVDIPAYCPGGAWQPDGDLFACSLRGRGEGLVIMTSAGKEVARVQEVVGNFAWSPDGTQIAAFNSSFGADRLLLISSDGTVARRVVDDFRPVGRTVGVPVWHPSDGTIWFAVKDPANRTQLASIAAAGGEISLHGPGSWPSWSRNGTLAYVIFGDRNSPDELWLKTADGSAVRKGVFPKGVFMGVTHYPQWSQDGRWLAVAAAATPGREGVKLYLLDTSRSDANFTPVADASGDAFAWSAGGAEVLTPVLHKQTKDGAKLKVVAVTVPSGRTRTVATPKPNCSTWFPAESAGGVLAYVQTCTPGGTSTLRLTRTR